MIRKPNFINPIQRVRAGAVYCAGLSLDGATPDGLYPVDAFHAGLASMDEEDYRQFELTPENAAVMVTQANADIASKRLDKKLRMNYGHDHSGPNAGEIVRVEITPDGGVRNMVRWTANAQAAIRGGEWDGTSPEFRAKVVLDEKGKPKEVNGRVLLQPFELCGGALHNHASMPDLAIAANTEPERPDEAKEEIMDMKKLALAHGLPETASLEDIEKAAKAKDEELAKLKAAAAKPAPATATVHPPGALDKETVATIAEAVLAQINPKELAKQIREASRADAEASIRAESLEKDCSAAVDAAILGGRVKKSERASALKLAKVDVDAFKTMTAGMKLVAPVSPLYKPGDAAEGETAVTPARHRFDTLGANASASDSADVRDFKEFIRWTAAVEAVPGTPKFKNAVEARQAFHAARINQERTA